MILFHHLAQNSGSGFLFNRFVSVGYLPVAYFFFLSGYGLQKSYITKSECYRKDFLLKRIPTVLIPYIIFTAIYWLLNLIEGRFYSLKDIIVAILKGVPIVSYSWYIIVILIFYFVYWLLMTIFKKHYALMIVGAALWYASFILFCIRMGYGLYWYRSGHLLILGMIWATYEGKILEITKKTYAVAAPAIYIAFAACLLLQGNPVVMKILPYEFTTMLTVIFFVLGVVMFALRVQIGNKVLGALGEMSLEIYLSQGLFITALRGSNIHIENDPLFCVAVLTGTIVSSHFLHITLGWVSDKYRLLLRKCGVR